MALAWLLSTAATPAYADAKLARDIGEWTVVDSSLPTTYSLQSVAAVSGQDAWAVGHKGYASNGVSYGPVIVRWNGHTWAEWPIFKPTDHFNLESVSALSPDDAWAVGGGDWWGDSFTAIWHWNGSTWSEVAGGPNYLKAVTAVAANDLWAVGVYERRLSPINSTWGAATSHWNGNMWEGHVNIGWFNLNSIAMISSDQGWAVGSAGTILRLNGGVWAKASSPTTQSLQSVAMIAADNGWAVGRGGVILHWDGDVWRQMSSPVSQALNSVAMLAADAGWIVGGNGVILHWDGDAWSQIDSPVTQTLKSVTMLSADEGWAVGEQGTILRYAGSLPPSVHHVFLPMLVRVTTP